MMKEEAPCPSFLAGFPLALPDLVLTASLTALGGGCAVLAVKTAVAGGMKRCVKAMWKK